MVILRRCSWWCLLLVLVLSGSRLAAASREERTFLAANADFQARMWGQAERDFDQFIRNYRHSTNLPLAVLLKAQAQYQQQKYPAVITLLSAHQAGAGPLADQYQEWIAESHFAASNYPAAAAAYRALARNYPASPAALSAEVRSAAAYEKLGDWAALSTLLGDTNSLFVKKAAVDAANELVQRGRLLLAQAGYEQNDYGAAAAQLAAIDPSTLKPGLDWQYHYLLCRVRLAAGELDAALSVAATLNQIAQLKKDDAWRAESVSLQAEVLEKLGRVEEAINAYRLNLAAGVPEVRQGEAIWKIAALSAWLGHFSEAEAILGRFLDQFPGSAQVPIAQLSVGELQLKEFLAQGNTNQLAAAAESFNALLRKYPEGGLAGKATLDRGWCQRLAGNLPAAWEDFNRARQSRLAPTERALAQFKVGDVLLAQKDYAGALTNYRAILADPAATEWQERAAYQSLRCNLALANTNGAAADFARIAGQFVHGTFTPGSVLLYGESLGQPAEARALFTRLLPQLAGDRLTPELRLALARTYEQEGKWPEAITNYQGWLLDYTNHILRPQATYALALAEYQAGDEAAALNAFTNFVSLYPDDANAPGAQWWVAEHYFRAGDYLAAEPNYEAVFQSANPVWKKSPLVYPAQLMAGRCAMGRIGYKDAVDYFTHLLGDTNCTDELLATQTRFACAAALMHLDAGTTNALVNLQTATNLLGQIIRNNGTNEFAAEAWGGIGDCALQMPEYAAATNAYLHAAATNLAGSVAVRSRAQVGYGLVLDKLAAQAVGNEQEALYRQARDNYLAVFYRLNLQGGEVADPFWVKKAGLLAAPLVGRFDGTRSQRIFYQILQTNLPALTATIQQRIAALPPETIE